MLAVVDSYWVHGVEGKPVRVEVKVQDGLPIFTVVGLPAGAVRESKERVFAALAQSGFALSPKRVTVNLAPADLPKSGSGSTSRSRLRCWARARASLAPGWTGPPSWGSSGSTARCGRCAAPSRWP